MYYDLAFVFYFCSLLAILRERVENCSEPIMYQPTHYIMRDQVRGLVTTLSQPKPRPRRITVRACLEVSVFCLAVAAYVAALALTT
jgi:hypothetical protein